MITETLKFSDYEIYEEKPSKIDPSKTTVELKTMGCPKCHHIMIPITHGQTVIHNCGLKMTLFGNALHCIYNEE